MEAVRTGFDVQRWSDDAFSRSVGSTFAKSAAQFFAALSQPLAATRQERSGSGRCTCGQVQAFLCLCTCQKLRNIGQTKP